MKWFLTEFITFQLTAAFPLNRNLQARKLLQGQGIKKSSPMNRMTFFLSATSSCWFPCFLHASICITKLIIWPLLERIEHKSLLKHKIHPREDSATDIKMKVLLLHFQDTRGDKRRISMLLIDSRHYNLHERLQEVFIVMLKEMLPRVHLPSPIAAKLFKRLDLISPYIT